MKIMKDFGVAVDTIKPVSNATYWKRQYNLMSAQNDRLKSGLYHANEQIKYLETQQYRELSDEEILHIYSESYRNTLMGIDPLAFARSIIEASRGENV